MTPLQAAERLANPVYQALTSTHRAFALREGSVLRYHPEVLPFAAVGSADTAVPVHELLASGPVFFCDLLPALTGTGFSTAVFDVLQMLYCGPFHPPASAPGEAELTLQEAAEMVELTDVAFPGFFRPETPRLGRYLGLREHGQLVAMAGERMRVPGLWELSAVCTRPGHTGRGHAAHLIERLMNERPDEQPFLHVSADNHRAIALYQRLNFVPLRTIKVLKLSKATPA